MQPEHYDFDNALYLPVSEKTVNRLIASGENSILDTLSNAELSAILVIQNLTEIYKNSKNHASEQILKKLIAWGNESASKKNTKRLLSETRRLLDLPKLKNGLSILSQAKIELLSDSLVEEAAYLLPNGDWDTTFRGRYFNLASSYRHQIVTPGNQELWLSDAQNMIVRTLQANTHEHLHIQGYAGIGKSFLISSLLNFLNLSKTIVLVKNTKKLNELKKRSKLEKFKLYTFEEFSFRLISNKIDRTSLRNAYETKQYTNAEIARNLNISSVKELNENQVVSICMETINSYCLSDDYSLKDKHLPNIENYLSQIDRTALLEYSIRIWQAIDPSHIGPLALPFNGFSVVKKASLLGCTVHPSITHILIDESHDLPPSLLKILERGPQCLITLGDEYQRLTGKPTKRGLEVRQKEATQSVRTGKKMEQVLNPLIYAHPNKLKLPFEGAKDTTLNIYHYDMANLPPPPTTILVASRWGMLLWFWSLNDSGHYASFMGDSAANFSQFAHDCLRLFRDDTPSTHSDLVHYPNWNLLSLDLSSDESFRAVERTLQNGYKVADLTTTFNKSGKSLGNSYTLALAEEIGNMEFNSVIIANDLMPDCPPKDGYELDRRISTLYTAISRAIQELYLPIDIEEWLANYRVAGLYIPAKKSY
ncbi:hypothetical protein ACYZTX_25265 [Pseudomonas sp. MDT1-17]